MAINIRTLTTGERAGSGIFDEMMRTVSSQLEIEFKAGRITGADYAQVYIANMQATLQMATQFALQAQLNDKQLDIMDEQVKQSEKQTALLDLQLEKLQLEIDTMQYQLDNILPQQLAQLVAQTNLATEQRNLVVEQITQAVAQTSLTTKQEDLVDEQIRSEQDKHTDPTGGTNKAAYDKLVVERQLGEQKIETEKAQVMDVISSGPVAGVVGKEKILKTNQAKSFAHNAAIQNAKLYTDAHAVVFSTEPESAPPGDFGFTGTNTVAALNDARAAFTDFSDT